MKKDIKNQMITLVITLLGVLLLAYGYNIYSPLIQLLSLIILIIGFIFMIITSKPFFKRT